MRKRQWMVGAALFAGLWASPASAQEPWIDNDPSGPKERFAVKEFGFRVGAEYRAQMTHIQPVSLNTVTDKDLSFIDHRLRLDAAVDYMDKVRIVTSMDALSGVLWGDNGTLGKDPEPTSGSNLDVLNVNNARVCVGYRDGDKLTPGAYGYQLCPAQNLFVRRAYGEVRTPVGIIRVGRQPFVDGMSMALADGDGRKNRWGVAYTGNNVDGILFATKPLEAIKPKEERDLAEDRGLVLAGGYHRLVTDGVGFMDDDVHNVFAALRYKAPLLGPFRNLEARGVWAYRFDERNATGIHTITGRAFASVAGFTAGLEGVLITGKTREVSAAYQVINNDDVFDQEVMQIGARGVLRYDHPVFSVYFEVDYASGDENPETSSAFTNYQYAPDNNIGLLMFEHVLAFQTARSAAAGVEALRQLGAPSLPAQAIATEGSFTNAIAIFPQLDIRPIPTILLRGGVLVAWGASRVIDPINSLLQKDGASIEDDLVNYAGGKPGRFYGVEIDGRAQWRYADHFALDIEGAILFPGDAFWDRNGDAVRAGLVQARTSFFF